MYRKYRGHCAAHVLERPFRKSACIESESLFTGSKLRGLYLAQGRALEPTKRVHCRFPCLVPSAFLCHTGLRFKLQIVFSALEYVIANHCSELKKKGFWATALVQSAGNLERPHLFLACRPFLSVCPVSRQGLEIRPWFLVQRPESRPLSPRKSGISEEKAYTRAFQK